MYICECGCVFQEPEAVRYDHGFVGGIYEDHMVCPHCGLENYDEAVQCLRCRTWIPAVSVHGSCFCEHCRRVLDKRIRTSFKYYKDPELRYVEDRVQRYGMDYFMEWGDANKAEED